MRLQMEPSVVKADAPSITNVPRARTLLLACSLASPHTEFAQESVFHAIEVRSLIVPQRGILPFSVRVELM